MFFKKVKYLGRIEYDFQKSHVTGPWDHKVSVSAKKVKKKFHACVPLSEGGLAQLIESGIKKGCVFLYFLLLYSRILLLFTATGYRGCRNVLYRALSSGSFIF